MNKADIQKIRAIVYDAYCEGDTEAEWMLVVIDAALAATEPELFAWATFDGEGSYDLRLYENNENYRDEYIKRNGDKYAGWVIPLYTAPEPEPVYDQTALELCEVCGWKTLIPGDGCLNCERAKVGQEPVAWVVKKPQGYHDVGFDTEVLNKVPHGTLLYIAPVAAPQPIYMFRRLGLDYFCTCTKSRYDELSRKPHLFETKIAYTAPVVAPQREWVGLTEKERTDIFWECQASMVEITSAITATEAALKEKNT